MFLYIGFDRFISRSHFIHCPVLCMKDYGSDGGGLQLKMCFRILDLDYRT